MEVGSDSQLVQILYAFGAGFLSSLTPCVYPMIPVTLAVFGASGDIARSKAFLLSLSYVFGIALTYTTLGVLSASTGMVFGSFLGNPLVVIALCLFLFVLALHSLEIVTIPLGALQSKASKVGGKGFIGALLMGMVSGVVAAPCIGPVLAIILLQAAKTQDFVWGGALLFSYSLGLGLIFLVIGTFSASLHRLPKSGNWLNAVKYLVAVGVIAAAYFLLLSLQSELLEKLNTFLHENFFFFALFTAFSLTFAFFAYKRNLNFSKLVTACICAIFITTAFSDRTENIETTELKWLDSAEEAFSQAKVARRPLMIDLYADWCVACKKLDLETFSNERVAAKLKESFIVARLDFTQETEESENFSERYNILGLPTILFLNVDQSEISDSRISGFLTADEFLKHIKSVEEGFNKYQNQAR